MTPPSIELSRHERFHLTVRGEETDRPPIWIMRQAGRYMPEYRAIRAQHGFLDFCLKPEVAAAATLLPMELLDIDLFIIFNDILIPLQAMGLEVEFPEGGPKILRPVRSRDDLERFRTATFSNPVVAESIRLVAERSRKAAPILGFCGAPFTLATYAVEGKMSKDQGEIRRLMAEDPALLHELLDRLAETAANYLIAQVADGGADGVQVFESWGSILPMPHLYEEFGARYQQRVIARFKAACPGVPVILYVRGSAGKIAAMESTGADILGLDQYTDMGEARRLTNRCLQGNLDPIFMTVPEATEAAVERMLEGFDWRRGWIANLGHGITPNGSVEAVKTYVRCIQQLAGRK
ncbi:uroporphyrinogen decarboxylase [bacterium]|nr:uroporphyrinogen decarboxylase [bacterium]